nr:uncharacterized protein LOC109156274 [Ipomoea batatas]
METESLPGKGSSAATTRSPEEEDLLQRSTKKTKRPRDNKETPGQTPLVDTVQEAALFAGLKSPDSANWLTPVETPNMAWGKKDIEDPFEKEEVPPTEGNQTKEAQAKTQRTNIKAPEYKDNYRSWMLVTRKERRGQRRADNQTPGVTNRGRIQA